MWPSGLRVIPLTSLQSVLLQVSAALPRMLTCLVTLQNAVENKLELKKVSSVFCHPFYSVFSRDKQ